MPPLAPEVPAAQGLEASMNQETVALSWQVGSKDPSALAGFTVYRAQIDPKVDDCPGCPLIFKRIAELPASEIRWQENRSVYVDRPEGGYRYVYKVTPYGPGGTGASCEVQTAVMETGK